VNPIIRHFLPSVIRGVYRFDDGFSEVEDEKDFQQFVEGKLKFLPSNLLEDICRVAKLSDFRSVQHQRTLPAELLETAQTVAQRTKAFFRLHHYFENALVGDRLATDVELKDAQNYLEIQFVKKILAPLLNEEGLRVIRPQRSVGPYFVDFALEGGTKLALEVDGFGKFKTRNELDNFTKRQNYITAQGWRVIRFTHAQVMKTTGVTLREMHSLLKADTQFRRFLTVQWHTAFFRELQPPEASQTAIDLVNNFYRIQDWLVEFTLAEQSSPGPLPLKDNFGFEIPFVASAISTLYEFLDAVASIADVDFELPKVEVITPSYAGVWAAGLHRLVSTKDVDIAQARIIDAATVVQRAGAVPVPSGEADVVKFRRNLSLNEIHERLQYFTLNIFGYRAPAIN
jgi:very-short-patch-repair endonuclease